MQTESDNESFDLVPMPLNKELLNAIRKYTFCKKVNDTVCSDEQKMDSIVDIINDINAVSVKLDNISKDIYGNVLIEETMRNNSVTKETLVKLYNALCGPVGPVGSNEIDGITKMLVTFKTKSYGNYKIKSMANNSHEFTNGAYYINDSHLIDDKSNKFALMTKKYYVNEYNTNEFHITDSYKIWDFFVYENFSYDVYLKNQLCVDRFIEFLLILSVVLSKYLYVNDSVINKNNKKDDIYVHNENVDVLFKSFLNFRLVKSDKKCKGIPLITFDKQLMLKINCTTDDIVLQNKKNAENAIVKS